MNINSSRKGSIAIVVLVVIIILLIAAVAWLYFKPFASTTGTTSTASTTIAVVQTTANWPTFENAAFGFSFKYPPIFKTPLGVTAYNTTLIVNGLATTTTSSIKTDTFETFGVGAIPQTDSESMSSTLQADKNGHAFDDMPSDCIGTLTITTTTIGNEQAVRVDCTEVSGADMGLGSRESLLGPSASLVFYHNGMRFSMILNGDVSGQDVLGEIANSFVFEK